MAEWSSVEKYVKKNYSVSQQQGHWLTLVFETDSGRDQMVMVTQASGLIQFLAPFASRDSVAMDQVFAAMRSTGVLLGITAVDQTLLVTHSQVLETVDEEEIDAAFGLCVGAAELLAAHLGT